MNDLISRQDAIDAVCMDFCGTRYIDCQNPFNEETDEYYYCEGCYSVNILNDLSSAQPQRKTGKWIDLKCNQCGQVDISKPNFCPNCGADMRGEENG